MVEESSTLTNETTDKLEVPFTSGNEQKKIVFTIDTLYRIRNFFKNNEGLDINIDDIIQSNATTPLEGENNVQIDVKYTKSDGSVPDNYKVDEEITITAKFGKDIGENTPIVEIYPYNDAITNKIDKTKVEEATFKERNNDTLTYIFTPKEIGDYTIKFIGILDANKKELIQEETDAKRYLFAVEAADEGPDPKPTVLTERLNTAEMKAKGAKTKADEANKKAEGAQTKADEANTKADGNKKALDVAAAEELNTVVTEALGAVAKAKGAAAAAAAEAAEALGAVAAANNAVAEAEVAAAEAKAEEAAKAAEAAMVAAGEAETKAGEAETKAGEAEKKAEEKAKRRDKQEQERLVEKAKAAVQEAEENLSEYRDTLSQGGIEEDPLTDPEYAKRAEAVKDAEAALVAAEAKAKALVEQTVPLPTPPSVPEGSTVQEEDGREGGEVGGSRQFSFKNKKKKGGRRKRGRHGYSLKRKGSKKKSRRDSRRK